MSAHDTKFNLPTELCAETRKQLRDLNNALDDGKLERKDIRPCKKCHMCFYSQFGGLKQEVDNLSSKLNEDLKVEEAECTCLKEDSGRQAEEHCMKEDIGISGSEVKTRNEAEKGRQHIHSNDSGYVSARFSRLEEEDVDQSNSDKSVSVSENVSDSEAEHNASRAKDGSYITDISLQDENKNGAIHADLTDSGIDKSESVLDENIQFGNKDMISMKPTVSLETEDSSTA